MKTIVQILEYNMIRDSKFLVAVFLLLTLFSSCQEKSVRSSEDLQTVDDIRIVSLSGAITEIVYELGFAKHLVGRDATSAYPDWVRDSVTSLGAPGAYSAESILSVKPTLVLASGENTGRSLEKPLAESGVRMMTFSSEYTIDGVKNLISAVSEALDASDNASALIHQIDLDISKVQKFDNPPKVLFIYARGAGTLLVAGKKTQMDEMIRLSGALNAVTSFDDFKPLTEESLMNSNPDVILLFDSSLEGLGGKEGFLKVAPAISQTHAGRNQAIISMDGTLLSNFGPRVGQAAYQLNQELAKYAK